MTIHFSTQTSGLVAILAALLLGACATPPQSFEQRKALMPTDDDVIVDYDWYRPLQAVAGRERPWTRAVAQGAAAGVESRFARFVAVSRQFETLALVVVRDGQVVLEDYAAGFTARSRFNTQSMHRGLLTVAVLAALSDGRLPSLDARIGDYLPAWRTDPRGDITVAQLLYGRSGIASAGAPGVLPGGVLEMFLGTDIEAAVLGLPAAAPPGGAYRPNEVEAQILGHVLDGATGEPYARYLSRRLWQPLGAATAYVQLDRPGGHARMFCCILATALDWARVGQLVLDEGRVGRSEVVAPRWMAQLRTTYPDAPASGPFWFLQATALGPTLPGARPPSVTPFARADAMFAGGRGGQRVYVIPSLRTVVVRIGRIRNDYDDGAFLNPLLEALQ